MAVQDYRLHCISINFVNVYLIYRKGEAILVDTGRKGDEVKILDEMQKLGIREKDLKLILLTHSHYDHAGSARRLKEICGCPLAIHKSEASRLEAGRAPIPSGTRWKASVLVLLGRIFARSMMKFPSVLPDILVDKEFSLAEFAFPGRALHCPGHTPGSLVITLDGGEMITGDSMFGLEGKRIFPPFAEDVSELKKSWKKISLLDSHTYYPAHGASIKRENFLQEFSELPGSQ